MRKLQELKIGVVASLGGRYFGMDRDKRWDRVEKAYRSFWGEGPLAKDCDPLALLQENYNKGINDEFVEPTVLSPEYCLREGDECFFLNFRADRMREIVAAIGSAHFDGFTRQHPILPITCMTSYDEHFPFAVVYEPNTLTHIMGEVVADAGLKQFRIAETEKYAHVTFFFNGGKEEAMNGEERILIPSPRDVATYDLKPAMSAIEVTNKLVDAINRKEFTFLVANFANADMVGHTGVFSAAVRAVETLDQCLQRIEKAALQNAYHLFISADHGNVEEMQDSKGIIHTQHTLNPVPFIFLPASGTKSPQELKNGILADIMPTMLSVMHLEIPKEVTGKNLLV